MEDRTHEHVNINNPENRVEEMDPNRPNRRKGGPKGPTKHGPLVEALLANEAYIGTPDYKSPFEMAERFGVGINTIYTYRQRLAIKGKIKLQDRTKSLKSFTDESTTEENAKNKKSVRQTYTQMAQDPESLIRSISEEPLLGHLDRLRVLARLVRTGSPLIKISAIKAIEDLSKNTEGRVGPPPPLTEEDYVARMAKLMLAIGEAITEKAKLIAFPTSEPKAEEALQHDAPILPEALGPPTRGVLDLSAPPISSGS